MAEPVSLETAKAHLRILDASEDALIAGYIAAARVWVEKETGHILVRRKVTDEFPAFGAFFDLMKKPFDPATVAVAYTDTDGVEQTVSSVTVNGSRVRPAYNSWWPNSRLHTPVKVSYIAGYADVATEEPGLISAVLIKLELLEDRGKSSPEENASRERALISLCDHFRAVGL